MFVITADAMEKIRTRRAEGYVMRLLTELTRKFPTLLTPLPRFVPSHPGSPCQAQESAPGVVREAGQHHKRSATGELRGGTGDTGGIENIARLEAETARFRTRQQRAGHQNAEHGKPSRSAPGSRGSGLPGRAHLTVRPLRRETPTREGTG